MLPTLNTLPEGVRGQSIDLLNMHLAAAIDLQAQMKQAHWNVRGPGFAAVHELFDAIASAVGGYIDLLAERAAGLGGVAHGTVQVAAEQSFLASYPLDGTADPQRHVFAAAGVLGAFGQSLREAVGRTSNLSDPVTADILTEILRGIDQYLWLIESHVDADSLHLLPEMHLPLRGAVPVQIYGNDTDQTGTTRSGSDWHFTATTDKKAAAKTRDGVEKWMNEGDAGNDPV